MVPALILAAGLLMGTTSTALAHGVRHLTLQEPDVQAFVVQYSTGDPVAYGEVKIYAPGQDDLEYQNGRTDAVGGFAFLPDRAGEWRIVVDAGMGHRHEFTLQVADGQGSAVPAAEPALPYGNVIRVALGLSLFANLFLAGAWFRSRPQKHKERPAN